MIQAACSVCDGTALLLGEPCPLCEDGPRGAQPAVPAAVDWQRRCRRCKPGRKGAALVKASKVCKEFSGVGRVRLTSVPVDVEDLEVHGSITLMGLARRFAQGSFKNVVVCACTDDLLQSSCGPSTSHRLLALLAERQLLRRVYVDGHAEQLQQVGLPREKVVTACLDARFVDAFRKKVAEDFPRDSSRDHCDLMLVFGVPAQVAAFCAVPNLARRDVPRVLVASDAQRCHSSDFSSSATRVRDHFEASYTSWVTFGRRRATLRPQWGPHFAGRGSSKYREQRVFNEDVDVWAARFAHEAGWASELENVV